MHMYDLIMKKRNGGHLSEEEIRYMVKGFTQGEIPDYQMAAMLMAIYYKGMNQEETLALTMEMAYSGEFMDLSAIHGVKVDKHSTGGVGDKATLVVGPMVAACGVPVAKMSGRGLGHTGGTIDKLESLEGFRTALGEEEFIHQVNNIHMALASQTVNLAPADKKIYALRDVTATVDSIPLIASSIMSKKLASGADAIVLDVKVGSGAFMKEEKSAIALAQEMIRIGIGAGRDMVAVITDMDEPLGYAVGNALEVKEAIETLDGGGSKDLLELSYVLGSYMLLKAKRTESLEEARAMLEEAVESKRALKKFKEFVKSQGGSLECVENTSKFPKPSIVMDVLADSSGFVEKINASQVGRVAMILGGGRATKESQLDLKVGVVLHKKVGDKVEKEDCIATLYANDLEQLKEAKELLEKSYSFSIRPTSKNILIKWIVTKNGARKA